MFLILSLSCSRLICIPRSPRVLLLGKPNGTPRSPSKFHVIEPQRWSYRCHSFGKVLRPSFVSQFSRKSHLVCVPTYPLTDLCSTQFIRPPVYRLYTLRLVSLSWSRTPTTLWRLWTHRLVLVYSHDLSVTDSYISDRTAYHCHFRSWTWIPSRTTTEPYAPSPLSFLPLTVMNF